jgi:hypothetical protein
MIKTFEDLGLDELFESWNEVKIEKEEQISHLDKLIKEKLGHDFEEMKIMLSKYLSENTEKSIEDVVNIAPHGKYADLIEDRSKMVEFVKQLSQSTDHWVIRSINSIPSGDEDQNDALSLAFYSKGIDEGDVLKGVVIIGFNERILHTFCIGVDLYA